jgi:hypothetical protein
MRLLALACLLLTGSLAAEVKLGKPVALNNPVTVSTLIDKAGNFVGKTVQVKGKITDVCQMMGCWMNIAGDDGKMVRLKVNDGEMVFPKDAIGKTAVAEGTFTKISLTREQAVARAKHEAEESGRKFDASSAKLPSAIYEIKPAGVVILE